MANSGGRLCKALCQAVMSLCIFPYAWASLSLRLEADVDRVDCCADAVGASTPARGGCTDDGAGDAEAEADAEDDAEAEAETDAAAPDTSIGAGVDAGVDAGGGTSAGIDVCLCGPS